MFYKSVFIHKNRVFPYFQKKVKNVNNIIIMIIKIGEVIIQKKKMNKKKRYNCYKIILNLVLFRINLA